jgi:cytochrome c biogenesis protein CcdA/glutaredoxin
MTRNLGPLAPAGPRPPGATMTPEVVAIAVRRRVPSLVAVLLAIGAAFGLVTVLTAGAVGAAGPDDGVEILLFWGDGCPYCHDAKDFLEDLSSREPRIRLLDYEVWFDEANRALMQAEAAARGVSADAVPLIVLEELAWVGYTPRIGAEVEAAARGRLDPVGPVRPDPPDAGASTAAIIDVPVVGPVDLGGRSLVVATVLIGFVDGVNPCSLWVLTVLLALVLHTGSRRRVAAVGLTFLAVTSLLYALFIIGVYSVLAYISVVEWIRLAVAAIAITFGLVNVKDYLWFKVGPSLTIPDERKPGIYRQVRSVARVDRTLPAVLAGTVLLAVGVSLVEIPCTAGFPVIWSDMVSASGAPGTTVAALLAVYLLVYLLDELIVFGAAVYTMRATKLQENHGRTLKLVGGMVMIAIGVAIVVAPGAMETVGGAVAVFAAALVASALVAGVRRVVDARATIAG